MNQRFINQRYSGCSEWIFFFFGLRNIKHINALSLRANNKTNKIELASIWDVLTHLNLLKHIHLTKCFWLEKMCSYSGSMLRIPWHSAGPLLARYPWGSDGPGHCWLQRDGAEVPCTGSACFPVTGTNW